MGHTDVLRIDFYWGDLVVENLTVHPGQRVETVSPHGQPTVARWVEDADGAPRCELRLGSRELSLLPGAMVEDGGLRVACSVQPRERGRRFALSVDSTLLHASMVSIAAHVCAVAALWLTPEPRLDAESGGGMAVEQLRRYIAVPSGTAREKGPPRFVARGVQPDEAERVLEVKPARGVRHARVTRTHQQSLAQVLDAISRELDHGERDRDLDRALGELSFVEATSTAIAQAGFGGLPTPRVAAVAGNGSGIIGLGESSLRDALKHARDEAERRVDDMRAQPEMTMPEMPEVPEAGVASVDIEELPEAIRSHILRQVRERQNSIRYCYESYGLPRAPTKTGRLLLEFTLQPDGHLTDVSTEIDSPALELVADCARERASEWFLGAALEEPRRLQFRFFLQPRIDDQNR